MERSERKREIVAGLLGCVVAVVLWLTVLGRDNIVEDSLAFQPFHAFHSMLKEIQENGIRGNLLGNIIMFVPLGILLPMVSDKARMWYRTALVGLMLSIAIEFTQLFTSRGFFEIDDMILNTLGTVIGYGACKMIDFWLERARQD